MKKIMLMLFALATAGIGRSQFATGDQYLSGSANFATSSNNAGLGRNYDVGFSPSFTKFTSNKNAFGFRLQTTYTNNKSNNPTNVITDKNYTLGLSLFLEKIYPLRNNFFFAIEKGIGGSYSRGTTKQSGFPDVYTRSHGWGIKLYLAPAIGYKLTPRLITALSFNDLVSLGYNKQESLNTIAGSTTVNKSNQFNLKSSLTNGMLGYMYITFGWKLNK